MNRLLLMSFFNNCVLDAGIRIIRVLGKNYKSCLTLYLILFANTIFAQNKTIDQLPAKLTADIIESDNKLKIISATGSAEFTKGGNSMSAKKIEYSQSKKTVTATGNVKMDNYQLGNMFSTKATFTDGFNNGEIESPALIFFDGSYIVAKNAVKKNEKTILNRSIFSLCPNNENSDRYKPVKQSEPISISSSQIIINDSRETIKLKNSVIRIYDIPILYSPYFKTLFPASKRKSGFLSPSYSKSQNLGLGLTIPYYLNINDNKDLVINTNYFPDTKHILMDNRFRHLVKSGYYDINLELANNNLEDSDRIIVVNSEAKNRNLRWRGSLQGNFILSKFSNLILDIDHVGDKEFLRDYKSNFDDHTASDITFINQQSRKYYSAKILNIQELSVSRDRKTSPMALPILEHYVESKSKHLGAKLSLLSNLTTIHRREGLQYKRLSLIPEVKLPYNAYGNLFEAKLNVQGNMYHTTNSYKYTEGSDKNYKKKELNYYPRVSFGWKLPMARKGSGNMVMFEPLIKFVASPNRDKSSNLYNEDVNDNELTQANLFLEDRLIGFDRNESGQRVSYGFNAYLFNQLGKFNLNLGQSQRFNDSRQDVIIRGFNDNDKSNIVGKVAYKNKKISLIYNFHLSESNYNNEVNDLSYTFPVGRVNFSGNYLLLKRSNSNNIKREQWNSNTGIQLTSKLNANIGFSKDLVGGKIINRNYSLAYNGCCVSYGISVSEENLGSFVKKQRSYNFNLTIKNL